MRAVRVAPAVQTHSSRVRSTPAGSVIASSSVGVSKPSGQPSPSRRRRSGAPGCPLAITIVTAPGRPLESRTVSGNSNASRRPARRSPQAASPNDASSNATTPTHVPVLIGAGHKPAATANGRMPMATTASKRFCGTSMAMSMPQAGVNPQPQIFLPKPLVSRRL